MARGEYCARNVCWFGNVVPCPECETERFRASVDAIEFAKDDGWSDPVGKAMKSHAERKLQELIDSHEPDPGDSRIASLAAEVERLKQELEEANARIDELGNPYCSCCNG